MAPEYSIDLFGLLHQNVSIRVKICKMQDSENCYSHTYVPFSCIILIIEIYHNILVAPNPIDNTSIIIEKMNKTSVKIMWKV